MYTLKLIFESHDTCHFVNLDINYSGIFIFCHVIPYINLFYSLQAWCALFMQSAIEEYRRYLFIGWIGILFYISSTVDLVQF